MTEPKKTEEKPARRVKLVRLVLDDGEEVEMEPGTIKWLGLLIGSLGQVCLEVRKERESRIASSRPVKGGSKG